MYCADCVRKELKHFQTHHSKYATLEFLRSTYESIAGAANAGGAKHLVHAKTLPCLEGNHLIVETAPVGVAYDIASMSANEQEAKLAIRGAVRGCGELHALGGWPILPAQLPHGHARAWIMVCPILLSARH